MTGSVFVVGSLHLDVVVDAPQLPAIDETVTGRDVDFVCGGKGGNQAVAAARHGAITHMAGRVGDDIFADRLLTHLDSAGVDRSQVQIGHAERSGMSVAVVLDSGDYGAVIVSAANLAIEPEAIEWPDAVAIAVLQNEIPEAVNISVARAAHKRGARVILNAAPWREMSATLLEYVDLLVLNRVEAGAMASAQIESAADAERAASKLVTQHRAVVVTLGAQGLVYCDENNDALVQRAFNVQVVSTHGAGDVFVGALAARLADSDDMRPALEYATAAAALHVAAPVEERPGIASAQVAQLLAKQPLRR